MNLKELGKKQLWSEVLCQHFPGGLMQIKRLRVRNGQTTFPTWHLLNASLQHYPHTNTVRVHIHTYSLYNYINSALNPLLHHAVRFTE